MTVYEELIQGIESMTEEQLKAFLSHPEVIAILGEGATDAV